MIRRRASRFRSYIIVDVDVDVDVFVVVIVHPQCSTSRSTTSAFLRCPSEDPLPRNIARPNCLLTSLSLIGANDGVVFWFPPTSSLSLFHYLLYHLLTYMLLY